MEKIVQMFESADAETVILGCILFLQTRQSIEFPGKESTNIGFYRDRTVNTMVRRECAIVNEQKNIALLLYGTVLHFTTDFKFVKDKYSHIFNQIETINI